MDEKMINQMFSEKFPSLKPLLTIFVTTVLALILAVGNGSETAASSKNANADSNQPETVNTKIVASVREIPQFTRWTETFQADESTIVATETSGRVAQILVGMAVLVLFYAFPEFKTND